MIVCIHCCARPRIASLVSYNPCTRHWLFSSGTCARSTASPHPFNLGIHGHGNRVDCVSSDTARCSCLSCVPIFSLNVDMSDELDCDFHSANTPVLTSRLHIMKAVTTSRRSRRHHLQNDNLTPVHEGPTLPFRRPRRPKRGAGTSVRQQRCRHEQFQRAINGVH